MWFTKIMFLVRTFNVTETVPHPVYLRHKVQSTKLKLNFDKIIKFMLEDDYNRLLIIIIIDTKDSAHPTTNYL